MLSKDTIIQIVEYGICAPSGDNSQPWKFEADEKAGKIKIFNTPEKDNPILNIGNRGTYVAHGALIENMLIAASNSGFGHDLKIFPGGTDLTAEITLSASEIAADPLFPFVKERCTNRKPYQKTALTYAEKEVLISAGSVSGCRLKLVDDEKDMLILAEAMSVTERIALETRELHAFFFKNIIWAASENELGQSGLYIKTLELPSPARFVFKIIRHWEMMKIFNLFKFNKIAANANAKLYARSAAHGAVICADKDENFVSAGRVLERIWLEATRLGLAFQPVTGTVFLAKSTESGNKNIFSLKNIELVREARQKIDSIFGVASGEIAAMIFRVGRANPPSARSRRAKPEIKFNDF